MSVAARIWILVAVMGLLVRGGRPARADQSDQVNPFFGSFQTGLDIDVPAFRGLEPHLRLGYSSVAANGFVGVGWSLDGISMVTRTGPNRGVPTYTSADGYTLDGTELMACTATSDSPSCTTGGTHALRIESYQRIAYAAATDTWTVTEKDGTTRAYGAVLKTADGTMRWGLQRVTDLEGNYVRYAWWCDGANDCYPDRVIYNGAVVRFIRELRPDPISFATGRGLSTMRYRLRTVDVTVGGTRARAYALDYGASGGAVGVAVTPVTTQQFAAPATWAAADVEPCPAAISGDVTGDGRADLLCPGRWLRIATGTGYAAPIAVPSVPGVIPDLALHDLDGDNKADLLVCSGQDYLVARGTSTGLAAPTRWGACETPPTWKTWWATDVDGDGQTDLLYLNAASTEWRVMRSTGTALSAATRWGAYEAVGDWDQLGVADVTGDGRPDLVYLGWTSQQYRVMVNTGTALRAPVSWGERVLVAQGVTAWWLTDMDADGKADILYEAQDWGAYGYNVLRSTGTGFASMHWGDVLLYVPNTRVVDLNGDHRADLFDPNACRAMLSTGAGFAQPATWCTPEVAALGTLRLTDVTGDGLPDVLYRADGAGTLRVRVNLAEPTGYTSSDTTGRSLLRAITPYGRDAVVGADGEVTDGTHLPATQFATALPRVGAAAPATWATAAPTDDASTFVADVTGDGRDDLVFATATGWMVMSSRGTAFRAAANWGAVEQPRDWEQCWLRDLNGDGKADLLYVSVDTTTYRAALSTGTGFAAPTTWGTFEATGNWSTLWPADVNADGKTDLVYQNGDSTLWRVRLSTGTAFATARTWATGIGVPAAQTRLADVTGDHRPDLVFASAATGYQVMVNTGSRFDTATRWGDFQLLNSWSAWWLADMNGDGATDVLYLDADLDAKGYQVMLSTGGGFLPPRAWGRYDAVFGWAQTWVVDVNDDGRQDLLYLDNLYDQRGYLAMLGGTEGFAPPVVWSAYEIVDGFAGLRLLDADGDGSLDLTYRDTAKRQRVLLNQTTSDLVTSVDNGMGSTTTIDYVPSTRWSNTLMPAGMVLQTVSAVTSRDGRGGTATSSYSYAGGLWSHVEHRFLGFRKVTTVVDAAGTYTETYYHQHVGCIAKPEVTYLRDATGALYSYTKYFYQENSAPPYTSLLTDRWEFECNQTATCRKVVSQFGYDEYGDVLQTIEHGDVAVTGDEVTTVHGYFPDTTRYLVAKPAYENTYAGVDTTGALLRQTLNYYDGATAYTTAPTGAGNVTRQDRWDSKTGGYVTRRYTYDTYGNLTAETDETDQTQTFSYDPTYHLFRTGRCDALAHCSSASFDPQLGVMLSEVDANGNAHTMTYDALGRIASDTKPGAEAVRWKYYNWGDPTRQRIREILPDGTTDGLWSDAYLDGAMRKYRFTREGGFERRVEYAAMSTRVWKESAWYAPSIGETPRYQVHAYDGAGRRVRTTNADDSFAEIVYGNGFAQHTNEMRDVRTEYVDAAGRLIKVVEQDGTAAYTTTIDRDEVGREVRRVDAANRVSTLRWDSLDRKVRACAPDVGCVDYTYDAAGRQKTSTDAKAQTVTLIRDAVGRMVQKTLPDQGVVTWTYDEAGHGPALGGDQPTSITWTGGSDTFTYDAMGRVIANRRCILNTCRTLQWSYDGMGRQTAVTYPTGEVVTWTYDATGRLASVPGYVTAMAWDARDQLTSMTYANGVVQTYAYDDRQALASSIVTRGTQRLYDTSYDYDAAGRVIHIGSTTDAAATNDYQYDRLGRLTAVTGGRPESWRYDKTGRVTWSSLLGTYQYGDAAHPHAVTAAGDATYTYDANGNMITGAGRTLTWDGEDRLVSAVQDGEWFRFAYDPMGRRTARDDYQGRTRYYGALFELQPGGESVSHIFAGAMPVARVSSVDGTTYLHQDRLGSIQLVTDSTGAAGRKLSYSAYGRTVRDLGAAPTERQFQGHQTEEVLGLVYMNARYYDPRLARFISADSMVPDGTNPQALDRYAFEYDNPVNNVDPTGHVPVVAALVTALVSTGPWAYVAWAGLAFTAAGYVMKDPLLMTLGSILTGCAAGAGELALLGGNAGIALGGTVAALTSPLSPLDRDVKAFIGWTYGIASFMSAQMKASAQIEAKVAHGRALIQKAGKTGDLSQFTNPDAAAAVVGEISDKLGDAPNRLSVAGIVDTIIRNKDFKAGMVGPSAYDSTLCDVLDAAVGWIPSVRLHGIVHDGFGFAYIDFDHVGPGFGGAGGASGAWASGWLSGGNMLQGQVEGLYRWGNFDLYSGTKTDDTNRRNWR